MQKRLLNSLAELKSEAEENFNSKFKTLDEAFLDAYENGEFHEHSTDHCWYVLGAALPDELIAQIVPTVLRPLVNHAQTDEDQIKKFMEFHEEMVKWLNRRLKSTEPLLKALQDTRDFVVKDAKADPKSRAWLLEVLRLLGLVHVAIESRMGLACYDRITEYERLIETLSEGKS